MRAVRKILLSIVGCLGLVGLFLLAAPAREVGAQQDVLHEVRAGDELHVIAGYYYGDTRQWERIWRANRETVRNPNRIERGSYLRIPNATVPAESYADFLVRTRLAAVPPAARPEIAPFPAPTPAGSPETSLAAPPAPPAKAAAAPALPAKAPAPAPVAPAAPAKATAPAPAPPSPAPSPQAKAPAPAPQAPPVPAKAPMPPASAAPSPAPQPAPVAQAAKVPAPPAKRPLPPPPPPKEWYEEWGLDELGSSPYFLGGSAVLVLGLLALVIRRRRAQPEEA
jgi:hypothetical protein